MGRNKEQAITPAIIESQLPKGGFEPAIRIERIQEVPAHTVSKLLGRTQPGVGPAPKTHLTAQEVFWRDQIFLHFYGYNYATKDASILNDKADSSLLAQATLSKQFLQDHVLRYVRLLAKSNDGMDLAAAGKFLGPLARAVLKVDPSGRMLQSEWLPIYLQLARHPVQWIAQSAVESLGDLIQALLEADPSGRLFRKYGRELLKFEIERGKGPEEAGWALSRLALSAQRSTNPKRFMARTVFPIYEYAMGPKGSNPLKWGTARSLEHLAQAALTIDPSGRLFRDRWLPLFERGLQLGSNSAPRNVGHSLRGIACALLLNEDLRKSFLPELLTLYRRTIESAPWGLTISGAYESLDKLAEVLLAEDPSGELFKREWLPLYQRAFHQGGDSQIAAVHTLGSVARAIDKNTSSPLLLNSVWESLYESASIALHLDGDVDWYSLQDSLASAWATKDQFGNLRLLAWIPTFEKAFGGQGNAPQIAAANLGPLAAALLERDPSGTLLKEYWLPLYKKAVEAPNAREYAIRTLGMVGEAILKADPTGALLSETWEPLVHNYELQGALKALGQHGRPTDFKYFTQAHPWTEADLASPQNRQHLSIFLNGWSARGRADSIPTIMPLIKILLPHLGQSDLTKGKFSTEFKMLLTIVEKIGRQGTRAQVEQIRDILLSACQSPRASDDIAPFEQYLLYAVGRLCQQSPQGRDIFQNFIHDFIFSAADQGWFANFRGSLWKRLTSDKRAAILAVRMPTLMGILENPQQTARFLAVLGLLRHLYPYDASQYQAANLPPIAYAQKYGLDFQIAEFHIVPFSESFRRHIFYTGDPDNDGYAIELKIPGEQTNKRIIGPEHFDIAEEMIAARPQDPKVIKPIFFWRPRGHFSMYGKSYADDIVGIAAFEYRDGKRNDLIKEPYLKYVSRRTGIPPDELKRRNQRETAVGGIFLHTLGYAISERGEKNGQDTIVNTDAHNGNIKLTVDGVTEYVADFGAAHKPREMHLEWRRQELRELLFGIDATDQVVEASLLPDIIQELVRFEKGQPKRAAVAAQAIEELDYDKKLASLVHHLRAIEQGVDVPAENLTAIERDILQSIRPIEAPLPATDHKGPFNHLLINGNA